MKNCLTEEEVVKANGILVGILTSMATLEQTVPELTLLAQSAGVRAADVFLKALYKELEPVNQEVSKVVKEASKELSAILRDVDEQEQLCLEL